MTPRSCPRWDHCNAPICPLDPDWNKRVMHNYDPVCYYLTQAVKKDAKAVFQRAGTGKLFELISMAIEPMSLWSPRIRLAMERAKKTGTRMNTVPPKIKIGGIDVWLH